MDCLLFAAVSDWMAERPPEDVLYDYENEDEEEEEEEDEYEYEDDNLGPEAEEHRLLRHRQLTASGLPPRQVREMEETVRRSVRILGRQLPPPPAAFEKEDWIGVVGVMSGALFPGWIGWTLLVLGAVLLIYLAEEIVFLDNRRRRAEDKRADAEKMLADVRAVLERTGNTDLLPLQDW